MDERIVVGVDGSESSRSALRWAARQAKFTGASLEVVIAWEVPPDYRFDVSSPHDLQVAPTPFSSRRSPTFSATTQMSPSNRPWSRATRFRCC